MTMQRLAQSPSCCWLRLVQEPVESNNFTIFINEIVADGKESDWIELYNPTGFRSTWAAITSATAAGAAASTSSWRDHGRPRVRPIGTKSSRPAR